MGKSRLTEKQIMAALKQVETGCTVDDVSRKWGVSQATIYAWKAKYGGQEANRARRLRSLESENLRLKHLVAALSLDKEMLKAVVTKRRPHLAEHRTDATWLHLQYGSS